MKKIIMFVVVVLILSTTSFYSFSEVMAASETLTATTTANLNVREKPNTNAKKVGSIKKGTNITVNEKLKSGWSKITYNKKTAYVSNQYLKFNNTPVTSTTWNGKFGYYYNDKDSLGMGRLSISNDKSGKFYFTLEVGVEYKNPELHFNGGIDGYATYKGNSATAVINDGELSCKMTMTKTEKGIVIKEVDTVNNPDCGVFRGERVSFDGTFTKR